MPNMKAMTIMSMTSKKSTVRALSFIADITSIQDLAREVIDQDKEKKIWTRYTAWKRPENSMPDET